MEKKRGVSWGAPGRTMRRHFLLGIIVFVPIVITVLIFIWAFNAVDGILQPTIRYFWGQSITGLGVLALILLILLAGFIASNIIGKRLIRYLESLVSRIPLVSQLYRGIKEIVLSFSGSSKARFMEVVLVEFPRKGIKAIGFVTNKHETKSGETFSHVFIPTSPNPTSGFLEIVKDDEITRTNMSVDDALKLIISVGKVREQKRHERRHTAYYWEHSHCQD